MIAPASFAVPPSFAFVCDMIEVDPLLGAKGPERHLVSLVARRGRVTVSGWDERLRGFDLRAHRRTGGWEIEGDLGDALFSGRAMAKLKARGATYSLEWGVAEQHGRLGQWRYSPMARGRCRPSTAASRFQGTHP
ncbi:MAG: hypothetical protein QOJ94_1629 [Sphingomonadales bacterium]|jgi:hypothetical protein|nr:hypothetical protein [Sphingomonadales bacterium]